MRVGHAFLWEYSDKRLQLAQLLGQLGVFLTPRPTAGGCIAGEVTSPAEAALCAQASSPHGPAAAAGSGGGAPGPAAGAAACSTMQMGLLARCLGDCGDCQSKMGLYTTVMDGCASTSQSEADLAGPGRPGRLRALSVFL
jgi:hypothetical protein